MYSTQSVFNILNNSFQMNIAKVEAPNKQGTELHHMVCHPCQCLPVKYFRWLILYLLLLTVVWRHLPPRSLRKLLPYWSFNHAPIEFVQLSICRINMWSHLWDPDGWKGKHILKYLLLYHDEQIDKHMSEYIEDNQDDWIHYASQNSLSCCTWNMALNGFCRLHELM